MSSEKSHSTSYPTIVSMSEALSDVLAPFRNHVAASDVVDSLAPVTSVPPSSEIKTSLTSIKVSYSGEIRRLPSNQSYFGLRLVLFFIIFHFIYRKAILEAFPQLHSLDFFLQYIDEDNEHITVRTETDYKVAIHASPLRIPKFAIVVSNQNHQSKLSITVPARPTSKTSPSDLNSEVSMSAAEIVKEARASAEPSGLSVPSSSSPPHHTSTRFSLSQGDNSNERPPSRARALSGSPPVREFPSHLFSPLPILRGKKHFTLTFSIVPTGFIERRASNDSSLPTLAPPVNSTFG